MADIELVIKINEDTYRRIQALVRDDYFEHDICGYSMQRIANGIPLPKGHGRLGDLDELNRIMYRKAFETDSDMQKWDSGCWIRYKMFENSMKEMPTIIEADKAESEG